MTNKEKAHRLIVAYTERHPEMDYKTIANNIGIGFSTLTRILKAAGYRRTVSTTNINLDKLEG